MNKSPICHVCGWRKGGVDSWDGKACKCGLSEPARDVGDRAITDTRPEGIYMIVTLSCGHEKRVQYEVWRDRYKNVRTAPCLVCIEEMRQQP